MTIDPTKIKAAKEWADSIANRVRPHQYGDGALAAAEVIDALPDTIVDGEKLRAVIDRWGSREITSDAHLLYREVKELLPAPKPHSLADMTPEEREACQWRMVATPEGEGVYFAQHANAAAVIYPSGRHIFWVLEEVVPLLDRPGMVWPGKEARTEDTPPAETVDNASSDTSDDPQPEDVPAGEVWVGVDYGVATENKITLTSRLVPAVQA